MFNLEMYNPKCAQITAGLDGYSQRLREIVNRHNTNDNIREFITGISHKTQITGKSVFLRLYNIIGYETEGQDDFEEFKSIMIEIEPKLKKKILLTTHSTPLRPSPCTPLAYAEIQPISKLRKDPGRLIMPETDRLAWYNSRYEESEYTRLESMTVERYTHEHQRLFHFIATSSKLAALKSAEKMMFIKNNFDLKNIYREYDINEQIPTWFLHGYTPQEKIKKMRLQMKRKIESFKANGRKGE